MVSANSVLSLTKSQTGLRLGFIRWSRTQSHFRKGYASVGSSQTIDHHRNQLLLDSLQHVPAHGWTQDAITTAASGLRASLASSGLISPSELIAFAMDHWNQRLRGKIAEKQWSMDKVCESEKICWAFQCRLEMVGELILAHRWHEGMAKGLEVSNFAQTQQKLAEIVDLTLGQMDGFSFSAMERYSLGAIYVASELYMLSDKSPDFAQTWTFLRQRVDDWKSFRDQGFSSVASSDTFYAASHVGSAVSSGILSVLFARPQTFDPSTPSFYDTPKQK